MAHLEVSGLVGGILSIIVGIVVIVWPLIIAFIIGLYLVIVGVIAVPEASR